MSVKIHIEAIFFVVRVFRGSSFFTDSGQLNLPCHDGKPAIQHPLLPACFLYLVSMTEVRKQAGNDLACPGILKMLVTQLNLLAGQNIGTVGDGENPALVKRIEVDLSAPGDEMSWKVHPLN